MGKSMWKPKTIISSHNWWVTFGSSILWSLRMPFLLLHACRVSASWGCIKLDFFKMEAGINEQPNVWMWIFLSLQRTHSCGGNSKCPGGHHPCILHLWAWLHQCGIQNLHANVALPCKYITKLINGYYWSSILCICPPRLQASWICINRALWWLLISGHSSQLCL